ncbi:DNA-3-methyladenine glycosylase [Herpetosiphon sp.]|uniref:Putative 3-methyladenine DNA glycosylase n=1 Tax=Herpetosiphon aurantiacus (strain ATCC 23779 / DSM 785 / 114-95) TaxID=316274 RepID=3MGH_HERA2|nr:DNA-3-methyladenine glycosylase [Herpetosiphon sp.]A9B1N9.1 RecName: Full=Putative 3-methyladenine DNA glycosylase [Herpetosiphon aurantiacus DSM 785]ABX03924.1 DNA-3-methyladenine glycosylase [Herpetosiphon aurantiacus DSM 785]
MSKILSAEFHQRHSLVVARELLGCSLVRRLATGEELRGRIVETEAYTPDDPSCHAHRRNTPRARSMFALGGISYVYIIYGIYHCLNVVTQGLGEGAAVLIRAIEPLSGNATMAQLVQKDPANPMRIASGPGMVCRALAVDKSLDGVDLSSQQAGLWFEQGPSLPDQAILQTPRIGINSDPHTVAAPWRLIVADSKALSGTRRQNQGQAYQAQPDWFQKQAI